MSQKETFSQELFNEIVSFNVDSASLCCYAILLSALVRGLKVTILPSAEIRQVCVSKKIKYNKNYHRVGHVFSVSDGEDTYVLNKTEILDEASRISLSKSNIKKITECVSLLSPKGILVNKSTFIDGADYFDEVGLRFPVVLKPLKGSMGRGVVLGISNAEELTFNVRRSNSSELIIEEQVEGEEYRIYFVKGEYYGAVRRVPAHVTGDGESTTLQLIEMKNVLKKRKKQPAINLTDSRDYVKRNGSKLEDVLAAGEVLNLNNVLGRSSGGDVYDVSESFSEEFKFKLEGLKPFFSNSLCIGLDVIVDNQDIYVIEANDRPQLSSLLVPDAGRGINIADSLLQNLFPDSAVVYKAGKGSVNLKKAVGLVKKYDVAISLDPDVFNFLDPIKKANDVSYKNLVIPTNSNRLMYKREAFSRGLSVLNWVNQRDHQRWSITSPQRSIVFRENMPSSTSQSTRSLTNDKERTKRRLVKHCVKVPAGIKINSQETDKAISWYESLESSSLVVVKPFNGSGGKGVTSGIATQEMMLKALASLGHEETVLEEHIPGFDYRLLVVAGKFKYAIKRQPAHIVGDGVSSIEDLVAQKNKVRIYNPYNGKYPIRLDESVLERIKLKGFTPSSVLRFGETLYLQSIANIGAGGDSEDVTDLVHSDFIEIAERVYAAFNDMAFCGLDLITEDINKPAASQQYAVIEVNANCDFAMHHFPTRGEPRNSAGAIIDALFPESSRAPVVNRELTITGKVQGIGYRKWFARQATLRSIEGVVSNLEDGSVRAVIQGTSVAIDDLIRLASKGPAKAIVKQILISERSDAETYTEFKVV